MTIFSFIEGHIRRDGGKYTLIISDAAKKDIIDLSNTGLNTNHPQQQ